MSKKQCMTLFAEELQNYLASKFTDANLINMLTTDISQIYSKVASASASASASTHTKNGTSFENMVIDYINAGNAQDNPNKWQRYLGELFQDKKINRCYKTKTSDGIRGDTEDIIVETENATIKLSCKHNNNFLSHPRVKTFIKNPEFVAEYNQIKSAFDIDSNRKSNMYHYYEQLSMLTSKYIQQDHLQYYRFLYPTDVHIIHNDRDCCYYPNIPEPETVIVEIVKGRATKQGVSCNLILKFSNNVKFKLRIHNCEGNKAHLVTNPFKWETQII